MNKNEEEKWERGYLRSVKDLSHMNRSILFSFCCNRRFTLLDVEIKSVT